MTRSKRVIVTVIDGLGIGVNNGQSPNTLRSLITHASSEEKQAGVYQDLCSFINGSACQTMSAVVTPSYEGADSYKGHYEMIGVDVGKQDVFVDKEHLANLTAVYPQIHKIVDGVYTLYGKCYLSNNIEAELGTSINLIGDLDELSWEALIDEGRRISSLLACQRVIVMANYDVTESRVMTGIRGRKDAHSGNVIHGIIPSLCGLYDNNYHSYHIGRSLQSYNPNNLINSVLQGDNSIVLVGKVSDIFQTKGSTITNIPSVVSKHTYDNLLQALDTDARLIFGNFQQVDLMGHARQPKEGLKNLLEVCGYIDDIRSRLRSEDILLVTADHGNDPHDQANAHTREQVPLLRYDQEEIRSIDKSYGSLSCIFDIAKLHLDIV
jgi:phosphopentomutase